ncbi:hypothetical protein DNTS_022759 [Danionella cerebrum]|uniref:C-factor n=1 Tax=Danionella cerebrum TaxID=2873325 RepID=A0A553NKB8_9TELE|nr:hypothetical protein DNTS_022759 [Danionella translucida]
MAAVQACNILITGANRGLGLEMVKQLVENAPQEQHIFATCRDPDGPKSESAKTVGSLLGTKGLNLLINNAAILAKGIVKTSKAEDLKNSFTTNVIGPLLIIQEYLPYLQAAAKASGMPGMSCNKAAIINISTIGGSMATMPPMFGKFPVLPYCVSKAGFNMLTVLAAEELKTDEILCMALHPGWVKTDLGGKNATLEPKESIEGVLRVIGGLTEKDQGGFLDYTGATLPW